MRKSLAFSVYRLLRVSMNVAGVFVWDTHQDGPGLTMWRVPGRRYPKYMVIVGFYRSRKKRLFSLAHEMGHIMSVRSNNGEVSLKLRNRPCGEEKANEAAVRFLAEYNSKWATEFAEFYDWANRHSRRRKRMTDGKKIEQEEGRRQDHGPWESTDLSASQPIQIDHQSRNQTCRQRAVRHVTIPESRRPVPGRVGKAEVQGHLDRKQARSGSRRRRSFA